MTAQIPSTRTMTVSVIQFTALDDDNATNLAKMDRLLDVAGRRGSDLAVLPEVMTGCGASDSKAYRRIAEPIPGPTTQRLAAKAKQHGMYVIGSMFELGEEGKVYNTAPLLAPNGEIVAAYRKTHLFSPGTGPDIASGIGEAEKITPGDRLIVVETPKCKLGLAICADLRFHEVVRELALMGAEVIALPTAFPNPRLDHWEFTLRTRATDNQVFIAATGLYGQEPISGARFVGRSMVVDPWGVVVACAPDGEVCTTTEIDLADLAKVRQWYPLSTLRRPHVYPLQRALFERAPERP
jgi:deaminated glutathione amidase